MVKWDIFLESQYTGISWLFRLFYVYFWEEVILFSYSLPTESNRRKLWIKYAEEHGIDPKSISAGAKLCVRHFNADFISNLKTNRLTNNAVPSLVSAILEINIRIQILGFDQRPVIKTFVVCLNNLLLWCSVLNLVMFIL